MTYSSANLLLAQLSISPRIPFPVARLSSRALLLRLALVFLSITVLFSSLQTALIRQTPLSHHPLLFPHYLFGLVHTLAPDHLTSHFRRLHSSRFLGFHILLIPLWIMLTFLQLSSTLRRRSLSLHRRLGLVAIAISGVMLIPLIAMWAADEKWAGDMPFEVDFRHLEHFFSFKAGVWVSMMYWLVCMVRLYQTAAMLTLSSHRFWAYQFAATGFVPGSMRILTVLGLLCVQWSRYRAENPSRMIKVIIGGSTCLAFIMNVAVAWTLWVTEEKERENKKKL